MTPNKHFTFASVPRLLVQQKRASFALCKLGIER